MLVPAIPSIFMGMVVVVIPPGILGEGPQRNGGPVTGLYATIREYGFHSSCRPSNSTSRVSFTTTGLIPIGRIRFKPAIDTNASATGTGRRHHPPPESLHQVHGPRVG